MEDWYQNIFEDQEELRNQRASNISLRETEGFDSEFLPLLEILIMPKMHENAEWFLFAKYVI